MDRYVVMGSPVAHSQSPFIHAAFAQQTGQAMEYGRLHCDFDAFEATLQTFANAGGRGCNVTMPFKFDAFRLAGRGRERGMDERRLAVRDRMADHCIAAHGGAHRRLAIALTAFALASSSPAQRRFEPLLAREAKARGNCELVGLLAHRRREAAVGRGGVDDRDGAPVEHLVA